MKLPKAKIEQLTKVLIEAQNRAEELLNYPYPHDDGSPRADLNWRVFIEVQSGLNNIIETLKTDHVEVNKSRKHYLDITQEQKERIFERDLAHRRNTENMTARQRRFVDAILSD